MATNDEPPEKDVKDFEFRQLVKCRVYPTPSDGLATKRQQQLAASSKFGLFFTAFNNEVTVSRLSVLSQMDANMEARTRSTAIVDAPCDRRFTVSAPVVHLAVSGDELTLSVVTDNESALTLAFYDLRGMEDQRAGPAPFAQQCLSSGSGITLHDLTWNPTFPTLLAVCVSDGTVTLLDVTDSVRVKASASLSASCISWSPKGKQIMVGKIDGSSSQYDHDMALKRDWPAPTIFSEPHQVTDMVWVSTYTYLGSYLPQSADSTTQPVVVMTVSSKEGNTTYINFDDVCFGSGEDRRPKYYFHFLPQWEMIVVSSCLATETTIIARHLDDKTQWEHWNLEDSSRAELPVTESQTDSYPVGMCVSLASQQQLNLGDNRMHPPCPVVLLLSTDGVVVPFHMAYLHSQAPTITSPPQPLPAQGARPALTGSQLAVSAPPPVPAAAPAASSTTTTTTSTATGSSTGSLAALLATPSSFPPAAAAPPSSVPTPSTFGQPATVGGGGQVLGQASAAKPLFGGQPTLGFGSAGQPASSAPSFSFVPAEGAVSTSAAVKPSFSFAAAKSESGGVAPGSTGVKTNLLGAFTAAGGGASAAGGGGGAGAALSTPVSDAGGGIGAGDTGAKPFSFGAATTKPAVDKPPLLGPRPSAAPTTTTTASSVLGGGGSGQFSFSFRPSGPPAAPTVSAASSVLWPVSSASSVASGPTPQTQTRPPLLTPAVPVPGLTPAAPASTSAVPPALTPAVAPVAVPVAPASTPVAAPVAPAATLSGPAASASGGAIPKTKATSSVPPRPALTGDATAATPRVTTSSQPGREEKENDAILDATIAHIIAEEMDDFEKELKALRQRMSRRSPTIGTKEEMQKMSQDTNKMSTFCKDITSTTKEHCREVYDLKGTVLDMFAMVEECRSRLHRNHDPQYLRALQQRALDPATALRLQRMQHSAQHIAQCVTDADSALDHQWETHREEEKKTRIHVPNSDTLYRAIKTNHSVLVRQQHSVDRLQDKLRRLQVKNTTSTWDNSSPRVELNGGDGSRAFSPDTPPRDWRLKKADLLTPEKVSLLKESLTNHRVRKVKCRPLASLSQSRLVSVRSQYRSSSTVGMDSSQQVSCQDAEDSVVAPGKGDTRPPPLLTSTPVYPPPLAEGTRSTQLPTSFSGVAYFKPKTCAPAAGGVVGKSIDAVTSLSTGAVKNPPTVESKPFAPAFPSNQNSTALFPGNQNSTALFPGNQNSPAVFPGNQNSPAVFPSNQNSAAVFPSHQNSAPLFPSNQNSPAVFPSNQNSVTAFSGIQNSGAVAASNPKPAAVPASFGTLPASVQPRYENVTPTNFDDEVYEEEYDEYAGYEDDEEDEDEEDEEEAGFGDQYEYPAEDTLPHPVAAVVPHTPPSSLLPGATSTSKAPGFGVSKNLFSLTPSTPAPSSAGGEEQRQDAGDASVSGLTATLVTTTASGFGFTTSKVSLPTTATPAATVSTTSIAGAATATAASPTTAPSSTTTTTTSNTSKASSQPLTGGFSFSTVPSSTVSSAPGASLFGSAPTFGAMTTPALSAPSSPPVGFFSATADSTTTAAATTTTTASSGFSFSATSTTAASVFGGGSSSSASLFGGGSATTASVFGGGSASTSSVFGGGSSVLGGGAVPSFSSLLKTDSQSTTTTTTTTTVAATSVALASEGALFGKSTAGGVAAPGSLFAPAASSAASSGGESSSFGALTTSGSVLGQATAATATTTTTAAASPFSTPAGSEGGGGGAGGGLFAASPTATTSMVFGGDPGKLFSTPATTTAASTGSVFGTATTTTASTAGGLFAAAATTTTTISAPATGSLFGTPASRTEPSVFGTPAATSAPGGSLFGAPSSSSGGSLFGASAQGSVFGSNPSAAPTGSVFGGAATVATTTTTASPFGFGQGSGFGGFSKPAFGSEPGFGQGSGFGQTSSGSSGFGQSGTTTGFGTGAGFGQAVATTTTTATADPSASGGGGGLLFGGGAGGGVFGLGAKPSEEKAKQNVFGTTQTFDVNTATNNSLFGNKGSSVFGSSSQSSSSGVFGGGAGGGFATGVTGSGGVASMGFAVTQVTSSSAGGFGSPPAFGGSPSFGSTPGFGSAPAFGSSPSFGAIGSGTTAGFGSSAGFGSPFGGSQPASQASGFSSFASTNAPTFGSLAQTDTPTFGALGQTSVGFGSIQGSGGTGFGATSPGFGASQPQQPTGFGNSSFGSSPSFSSYRG